MGSCQSDSPDIRPRAQSEEFAPSSKQVYRAAKRIKIRTKIRYYLEEQDIEEYNRTVALMSENEYRKKQQLMTPVSSDIILCQEVSLPTRLRCGSGLSEVN
ncbi:hypothetical protein SS50377_24849 [Spironucleus salmonicida]|uniref:Uncharacterized protein n=1 Tax=Spironucleus salmonicida TaxID=348837 RepID=V6LX03_9EUKA|nr:hypothetical protein SS50377_24849 [Spironucleus salmonicida]|eukprot:EST49120.1 Hypothetical protein SS50377_10606 [Spironucleus salmonicida]